MTERLSHTTDTPFEEHDSFMDLLKSDSNYRADILHTIQSIDVEAIRTQQRDGHLTSMWGLVQMNELSFIFQASRGLKTRQLIVPGNHIQTKWWPHRPYHPEVFQEPFGTRPLDEEERMGVLSENDEKYIAFFKEYDQDKRLKFMFDSAVSLVCNEKEGGHPEENTTLIAFTRLTHGWFLPK